MSSSSNDAGTNPPPPKPAAQSRASSPDYSNEAQAAMKLWLDKVLEAFLKVPTEDPEKGISIIKVKAYLKEKHRVTKAKMKEFVNPALGIAVARKYVNNTTVPKSPLMGSARINPVYTINRLQHSEEGAAAEEEKGGGAGGRKRKTAASSTDEDGTKSGKRRLPFGKVN